MRLCLSLRPAIGGVSPVFQRSSALLDVDHLLFRAAGLLQFAIQLTHRDAL